MITPQGAIEQDSLGRPTVRCDAAASCVPLRRTPGNQFPGGHRGRVPPVPIPNTEVKPATADGTACAGVWESRSLPGLFLRAVSSNDEAAFSLYGARVARTHTPPH